MAYGENVYFSFYVHLGQDAINISGLLGEESRLRNPKNLGNFKN